MGATLLWGVQASHYGSFSCGAQALGRAGCSSYGTWAQYLWVAGLVALRHVESSLTRDRTSVPSIARQILNYWTTREAPFLFPVLDGERASLVEGRGF